ncbi:amylo-alpha-1,6-glucosidase [Nanoarchaeota archaeon]
MQESLVDEAYKKAIDVLKLNSTPMGFSASCEKVDNYYSVWARDHSICSIAAVLTGDKELTNIAKKGIALLLRSQKDHGQVPSYIEIENKKKIYGGLGSITSIDSNMWLVIASAFLFKRGNSKTFISNINMVRYHRLYRLLKAFDSNDCGLLEVHRAGDWADVFDRTYHVLYDECLYYQTLKALEFLLKEGLNKISDETLRKKVSKRIRWIRKRRPKVKRKINSVLWLNKNNQTTILDEYMIKHDVDIENFDYYQSHMMPFKLTWQKRFDSFGNLLAICTKVADKEKSGKIIKHVISNDINKPGPVKALYPPVFKNNVDWEHIYRFKEQPYTYHNGGVWPVIAGFWIYSLAKNNKKRLAKKELYRLAEMLKEQNWEFNEYMHGKTGKPMGRKNQAWSAAGYIIGYHAVKSNINLFDF